MNVRERTCLFPFALAIAAPLCAQETNIFGVDTLLEQAVTFLEKNLEDLRDIRGRAQAYSAAFANEAARHPCDICKDRQSNVGISAYMFEVEQAYPDRFAFTHVVEREGITARKLDRNEYRYRIPYIKQIPASPLGAPGGTRRDLAKPYSVHLIATLKYTNGRFTIENTEGEEPAAPPHLMLELAPLMAMGSPTFDDQPGFTPDVTDMMVKVGVVYYFNPFSELNKGNVWLKTGLRAAMRSTRLEHGDLVYDDDGLVHTAAIGAQGDTVSVAPTINVRTRASAINETVRSTVIEVPLGIGKRIPISASMDLSLEAEVSYAFEVARAIDGDYTLERTGTQHRILGDDVIDQSGGTPAFYDSPHAAVRDASTGEDIDFFTGRTSLLDDLELDRSGYLSFGFLPSVFIRSKGAVKYNIGLRFQMVGGPENPGTILSADHFTREDDTKRPALSSLSNSAYQMFIGLTLGLSL